MTDSYWLSLFIRSILLLFTACRLASPMPSAFIWQLGVRHIFLPQWPVRLLWADAGTA
jgi:hypothetical protein